MASIAEMSSYFKREMKRSEEQSLRRKRRKEYSDNVNEALRILKSVSVKAAKTR